MPQTIEQAAVGSISKPQALLRSHIARGATFQSWTGSADATEAETHVYTGAIDPPAEGRAEYELDEWLDMRPFCLVMPSDQVTLTVTHDGGVDSTGFGFEHSGALVAMFEDNVPDELRNRPGEVEQRFQNMVGQVLDDMLATAGQAGYLSIIAVRGFGPMRCADEEIAAEGDSIRFWLEIDWGVI